MLLRSERVLHGVVFCLLSSNLSDLLNINAKSRAGEEAEAEEGKSEQEGRITVQ